MNIDLRPDLERLIEQKLATGRYADRGAVIEEALEFVQRRDAWIGEAQAGYERGRADLKAGRSTRIDGPEAAQAFGDKIKQRGRELQAERENAAG